MLRTITSFLRNAPGPLKGARALIADLFEGVADVLSPPKDVDQPSVAEPSEPPRAAPETAEPAAPAEAAEAAPAESQITEPEAEPAGEVQTEPVALSPEPSEEPPVGEPEATMQSASAEEIVEGVEPETPEEEPEAADLFAAFERVISRSKLVRKQAFKAMAIFWYARRKGMGPLTAKDASALGEELGLDILHGNIRKMIRTKLADVVETQTMEGKRPPTHQYELLEEGAKLFEQKYLIETDESE